MKKELPIAVILLALGAWCCFQFPSDSSKQNAKGSMGASEVTTHGEGRRFYNSELGQAEFSDGGVVQTSWETPTVVAVDKSVEKTVNESAVEPPVDAVDAKVSVTRDRAADVPVDQGVVETFRAFPPAEFLKVAAADDAQATAAIVRIANGIQKFPAFATRTKIHSQLFGVSMAATGKYFQTVGGEKSRMEVQCFSPVANTVLQMSDGRFVYILKSDHQQQKLEFIDLFRLANHRGNAHGGLLPTTWVMGGGIGKAISHYAQSFDFRKVSSSLPAPATQGVTTYRGIWKASTLLHLINAGKPGADRPTKIVWADVPRQLPHAIELTFKTTAGAAPVPKQISFFKFSTDKQLSTAKEIVRIEFSPFEFKNSLPDELFTLESTDFEATDVTKIYNAQIFKLSQGMDKVANQIAPSAGRR